MEGLDERPGGAEAVAVLEQAMAERAVGGLVDWHARRGDWSAAWRESSGVEQSTLYLTEQDVFGALNVVEATALVAGILTAGFLAHTLGLVAVLVTQGAGYVVAGALVLATLRAPARPSRASPRQRRRVAL